MQSLLTVSTESLHCTLSHCDLTSHKRACFLMCHLVSPSHTYWKLLVGFWTRAVHQTGRLRAMGEELTCCKKVIVAAVLMVTLIPTR